MTDTELERAIIQSFLALYGNTASGYHVSGAGTDEIRAEIHFPNQPKRSFLAELDSDDDGFLRFRLDDCTLTVLVPYDQPYEATSYSGGDEY